MSIEGDEISVIIQGPFYQDITPTAIANAKALLPGCEVIFSTWKGEKLNLDENVKVIVQNDPGSTVLSVEQKYRHIKLDNCNRQIKSTRGGIEIASRKYNIKQRSDMVLYDTNFIDHYLFYQRFPRKVPFFKNRIVCNSSGTVDPRIGSVAHPGDFFFFGLAEDIRSLFDVPVYLPRSVAAEEWAGSPVTAVWGASFAKKFRGHFCPDMHIWAHHLEKHYGVQVRSIYDYSDELVQITLDSFVDNFIFLDDGQIGIDAVRHRNYGIENYWRNVDNKSWNTLLRERFGGDVTFPNESDQFKYAGYKTVFDYKQHVAKLNLKNETKIFDKIIYLKNKIISKFLKYFIKRKKIKQFGYHLYLLGRRDTFYRKKCH